MFGKNCRGCGKRVGGIFGTPDYGEKGSPLCPDCSEKSLKRTNTGQTPQTISLNDAAKSIDSFTFIELCNPIYSADPEALDDQEFFAKAHRLIAEGNHGNNYKRALEILQKGLSICLRKDQLCALVANIYSNQEDIRGLGWYMQSCLTGSPDWPPYLIMSYAAGALGIDNLRYRCLFACDVLDTNMPRLDSFETTVRRMLTKVEKKTAINALRNFEEHMDSYLPRADELPKDHNEREVALLQNLTGDLSKPPLSLAIRIKNRGSNPAGATQETGEDKCSTGSVGSGSGDHFAEEFEQSRSETGGHSFNEKDICSNCGTSRSFFEGFGKRCTSVMSNGVDHEQLRTRMNGLMKKEDIDSATALNKVLIESGLFCAQIIFNDTEGCMTFLINLEFVDENGAILDIKKLIAVSQDSRGATMTVGGSFAGNEIEALISLVQRARTELGIIHANFSNN